MKKTILFLYFFIFLIGCSLLEDDSKKGMDNPIFLNHDGGSQTSDTTNPSMPAEYSELIIDGERFLSSHEFSLDISEAGRTQGTTFGVGKGKRLVSITLEQVQKWPIHETHDIRGRIKNGEDGTRIYMREPDETYWTSYEGKVTDVKYDGKIISGNFEAMLRFSEDRSKTKSIKGSFWSNIVSVYCSYTLPNGSGIYDQDNTSEFCKNVRNP